ncbi:RHS repeat domain-containing protein [Flagellimonas beolgyonensis]|uniref:RHS repeat domain-containing protein n=1 Tax=Flagellimonas beolgyonensis TaxID=864064 RepID=UPI003D651698
MEESNYYPFGLKHKGYNEEVSSYGNSVAQKWKFGGKEYEDGLNESIATYDFGARNYDPALGRWMNLDPLAEQMRRHSPYNYAFDNPMYFMDYDGMAPTGCCGKGPGNPLGHTVGLAKTVLKAGVGAVAIGLSILGMDPIDPTGSGSDRSSSDGYRFVTEDGQPSGDPSTVTSTTGKAEEVDVTGLEPLTVVAGGKKAGKLDGMTNAKNPNKRNVAKSFTDGAERAENAGNFGDAVESLPGGSSMESANQPEPDSTTVTATRETGKIITTVNPPNNVTSSGGTENVQVRVPTNKVDSVNNASAQAIKNAEAKMQQINKIKLDSLMGRNN